ncbi:MAG: hypothetical protein JXX14_01595 [Deltaproteobacteria bacterium]|nr:hypothetical protein [Deltaproteobacteria bacterium]
MNEQGKKLRWGQFSLIFGFIHLLIDLVTVSSAFSVYRVYHVPLLLGISTIVFYDVLAFAGQSIIGWFSDRKATYHSVALAGIVMVLASVPLLSVLPVAALVLTGVGNAFYHVGAGALSLNVEKGRARVPGLFVAPGAIGLGVGTLLGKSGQYYPLLFIAALVIAFFFVAQTSVPDIRRPEKKLLLAVPHPVWVVFALLVSIAIRALVGFGGGTGCKKTMTLKLALMTVAFLGKGIGGVLSDRIGWIRCSVGALLISAPLIAFGGTAPVSLTVGLFFFQMTMPVTLVAVNEVMPGRSGLAFGLCCLALLCGSLLAFSSTVQSIYSSSFFFAMILVSAGLVFISLRHLQKKIPMKF